MTDMTDFDFMRTNGDVIAPRVDTARRWARAAIVWARDNPDELAVGVVPFLALSLATMRHRLSFPERALLYQCAYWGGLLAAGRYADWKSQPVTVQQKGRP